MFSSYKNKQQRASTETEATQLFTGFKKHTPPTPITTSNQPSVFVCPSGTPVDIYQKRLNKKIIILWSTIRPNTFKSTHRVWMENAKLKSRIRTIVAVDTTAQANELIGCGVDVLVTNSTKPGVCFPSYCLGLNTDSETNDIIVFASDDFFPPIGWDVFLYNQLNTADESLLVVNDGIQPHGTRIVTIPILTLHALKRLNNVIYHPAYNHLQSDVELFDVAERLGILRDIRSIDNTVFEHRHHCVNKRAVDEHDKNVHKVEKNEMKTYLGRKDKSIDELLSVDPSVADSAKKAYFLYKSTTKKLSILICTTPIRARLLNRLLDRLTPQLTTDAEIVIESDDGTMPIGHKRNILLDRSIHDYVCFVDDDDLVSDDYVSKIVTAIQSNPDCCSLLGVFTTNGINPIEFHHSIKYTAWSNDRIPYERNPNHLNAIRRELAIATKFNDSMSVGEDHDFSKRIQPLLKTESEIDGVLYHYLWLTNKDNQQPDTDKKVIGFSLWGSNPFYTEGVIKNCATVSEYYPGWVVWVYVNDTVPQSIIDRILAYGARVINVGGTDASAWGMLWRFAPTGDPTVAAFMSRDGDSRFSHREAKLVQEWMDSDKDFHIIRDNKEHGIQILGGMWGVKRGRIANIIATELSTFRDRYGDTMNQRYAHANMKNTDQDFLCSLIYPHTDGCRIAHVSLGLFVDGDIRIEPAADGNFIGKPVEWNE